MSLCGLRVLVTMVKVCNDLNENKALKLNVVSIASMAETMF